MGISDASYREAIRQLAAVSGVEFDPASLAEDVFLLGYAYDDEERFATALAGSIRALCQLTSGRVMASNLKYDFEGMSSYHFQAERKQGSPADMRIVFRREEDTVRVIGFGNRKIPSDIYKRLSASRLSS